MEWLLERLQELIDHGLEPIVALDRVDQQHELVAADARDHVRFANVSRNPRRPLDQQRVADGMTVIVVDVLEIVDVDERQREAAVFALALENLLDMLADERA